ncbi:toll/interleukin-1 receptor domain-containing protein [Paracoccus denitrificans]|nr:toll/interleukin-1 receptor domain-containing protein [Paracoccus denitrificans]
MATSKSQADIATKIAKKQSSLSAKLVVQANEAKKADAKAKKNQERVSKTQEEATRKLEAGYRKLTLENQSLEQRLQRELSAMKPTAGPTTNADLTSAPPHDIFISHAWEDKADFVEALAHTLRAAGAEVWYDDFSLRPGDSLRRSIDKGLGSSRFGIVVLSTHFFKKEWPQKELDGLFQLESSGRSRILPIWHKVSKDEVASFSPTMADKLAFNTSTKSVDEIVADLMAIIRD